MSEMFWLNENEPEVPHDASPLLPPKTFIVDDCGGRESVRSKDLMNETDHLIDELAKARVDQSNQYP